MVSVAFGFSGEHLLREQCFAPRRHKAFRVQIFWMYRPQSHDLFEPELNRLGCRAWQLFDGGILDSGRRIQESARSYG
jgi:hypothetical protein